MPNIKGRAFRHPNCSECPTRRNRISRIAKLEKDITLLKKFDIPTPKADSELSMKRHFQNICNEGKCNE